MMDACQMIFMRRILNPYTCHRQDTQQPNYSNLGVMRVPSEVTEALPASRGVEGIEWGIEARGLDRSVLI